MYSVTTDERVRTIDLGKSIDKVLEEMEAMYKRDWLVLSDELYKVIIDKADGEAYDKISRLPPARDVRRMQLCTSGLPM